jgi:hypothetical protein
LVRVFYNAGREDVMSYFMPVLCGDNLVVRNDSYAALSWIAFRSGKSEGLKKGVRQAGRVVIRECLRRGLSRE